MLTKFIYSSIKIKFSSVCPFYYKLLSYSSFVRARILLLYDLFKVLETYHLLHNKIIHFMKTMRNNITPVLDQQDIYDNIDVPEQPKVEQPRVEAQHNEVEEVVINEINRIC